MEKNNLLIVGKEYLVPNGVLHLYSHALEENINGHQYYIWKFRYFRKIDNDTYIDIFTIYDYKKCSYIGQLEKEIFKKIYEIEISENEF